VALPLAVLWFCPHSPSRASSRAAHADRSVARRRPHALVVAHCSSPAGASAGSRSSSVFGRQLDGRLVRALAARAIFPRARATRHVFNGFDPLVSRPPLANLVTGALLELTRDDFAHYQLISTLLASLAFLPAALLARRLAARAPSRCSPCFHVQPLFVQTRLRVDEAARGVLVSPRFIFSSARTTPIRRAPLAGCAP